MAHFAKLDENNVVLEVHVVNNDDVGNLPFPESEAVGIAFLTAWAQGEVFNWKQTSYNGNFRTNYAAIGGVYDSERDAFIGPQPYASWVLNETTLQWEAPSPRPNDGFMYVWSEDELKWILAIQ